MEMNEFRENALLKYCRLCTERDKRISDSERAASYGTIQAFVIKHLPDTGRNAVSQKLVGYIEYLSSGKPSLAFKVLNEIASLPFSIASEKYLKKIYRRLYKTKHERLSREKKGRNTIVDRHEQRTIRSLKEMLRHGITYYDPRAIRPSRSLQSLKNFIYNVYRICGNEHKTFDICTHISFILSTLDAEKKFGLKVSAKNIQGILSRTLKNLSTE